MHEARLDARVLNIQSGEQVLYEYNWKPGRDGSQWLELSIINGPSAQSATVLVDEPRSQGVFGTIGSVNPALLGIVVLLSLGLIGLLVFGLRAEPGQVGTPAARPGNKKKEVALPKPESGPYGAKQEAASPGENPYQ